MPLSEKQRDFIGKSRDGWNLAIGAIRSGKTFAHHLRILQYLLWEAEPGVDVLVSGKQLNTVTSNMLDPLEKLVNTDEDLAKHWKFPKNYKPIEFRRKDGTIKIQTIGAHDNASEESVRGMTLQAWFPDELPLHPEGFIKHAIGRLSAGKRILIGTGNPESQIHYVYRDFVSSGKCRVWHFGLQDNPSLDPDYIKTISDFYTGIYYDRYILGKWAGDPGRLVLSEFYQHKDKIIKEHDRPRYFNPIVGMDIGFRDFTFVVFGYFDYEANLTIIEDEIVLKSATTEKIAYEILSKEKALGYENPARWCDTDPRLIEDMAQLHKLYFIATRKDDKEAQINQLNVAIGRERVRINPRCVHLVRHCEGAIWNEKRTEYERTESEGHFDGVDAFVYLQRNINKASPVPDIPHEWRKPEVQVSPHYKPPGETKWQKMMGMD